MMPDAVFVSGDFSPFSAISSEMELFDTSWWERKPGKLTAAENTAISE